MSEINYAKVRVFFKKYGRAVYVSHLDLYRTFQRAFKRAKIPVWETEGFNKHIYLNFLLPLSLGAVGVREPLDVKICDSISFVELIERLNRALPDGMEILEAASPIMKATEIKSAEYEIIGEFDTDKMNNFIAREEILTEKRTKKKGINTIDLKPHIGVREICGNKLVIQLPAGCDLTINPNLVIEAYENLEDTKFAKPRVTRTQILCEKSKVFI